MVQPLDASAYLEQLKSLLPRGLAWAKESGTVLVSFLEAIAETFARIDREGANMLNEIHPDSTLAFLPDWERVLGLPDDCSNALSTVVERRAAVLLLETTQENLNPDTFIEIGERFGLTITVEEHDQARAAMSTNLDLSNNKWKFVWWVTIPLSGDVRYFTSLSESGAPLATYDRNTELECRLKKLSPAHTLLIVGYV